MKKLASLFTVSFGILSIFRLSNKDMTLFFFQGCYIHETFFKNANFKKSVKNDLVPTSLSLKGCALHPVSSHKIRPLSLLINRSF